MVLAQSTRANLIAVDMLPQFLEKLDEKIKNNGLSNRVVTKKMTMESLNFEEKSFDVIWSEGAIYNIGSFLFLRNVDILLFHILS
ncbi:class I SAM-dependent methyltransferase [Terrisporobacter petrolearius]|nr:class I SAM-dependent methyltransferase [Terrisporobacter petrolearius]MCC3863741.1 class I SAM-dependent methyltransferase [Terrisporobacter petrolearius]